MKRIALVGCGMIAKTHGLAIQDLGFECVGVTDIRPEAAEAFARNYPELRADWLTAPEWMDHSGREKLREMYRPLQVFPDLGAMKDLGPLDAVIIATFPGSHCDLTCEAATLGARAVLCEKPMALSASQGRMMIDACKAHGTRLAVYHESMMLLRQFVEARQIMVSGQIGKLEFVRANTVSTLMDWSPYLWASISYLLPQRHIVSLQAMLDCSGKNVSFGHAQEDAATVHFDLDDGNHGMLFTGRPGGSPHGIRIDGSEGSVEVSYISAPALRLWRQGTGSWEVATPPRACSYDDRRAFLNGIVTGDPAYAHFDGESALRSTMPIFAAWQSHQEQRPVLLAEPSSFQVPLSHG